MLAIALMCVLAAARLVTRSSGLRIRVAPVAAVIGYALLLQLGAPAYLYGRLMLSQDFVPFPAGAGGARRYRRAPPEIGVRQAEAPASEARRQEMLDDAPRDTGGPPTAQRVG